MAVTDDDGFVIALPYGPDTDWVRNVLANGSATIEHDGQSVRVRAPEFVRPETANPRFAAREQRMHAIFGTTDLLRLHRAQEAATVR